MEPSASPSPANPLQALIHDQAIARGKTPFLFDARSSKFITFDELEKQTAGIRGVFAGLGVRPGTRVGLVVANPLLFARWFFAGIASGLWIAPLDPSPTDSARDLIASRVDALQLTLILGDRDQPTGLSTSWMNVAAPAATAPMDHGSFDDASANGGVLLSSSGTTGTPKVMALPTAQLLATAALIAAHNELHPNDRGFNPLPLWHVNAEVVGLLSTLVAGASLVLDEHFHRTGFWKIIDDFEVTWINAVPAIISRLASLQSGEVPPTRVRFIRSASAPLSPLLFDEFESAMGIPIIQSYGMTEAASQICANPLRGARKSGSVGIPVGVDVRVVPTEDGSDVDDASVGYIEIKGPTVIQSYDSAAYDDRFDADGWLRTGDLGYFDDENYLFIVGRTDDVINRGGEKIYPLELENVLATVDGVAIVAVIGEPDDVFGHVPVAYVQPSDEAVLSSEASLHDLVAALHSRAIDAFAKAWRPAAVKIVASFPSHATGKIQKGQLRKGGVTVLYEERL